VNTQLYAGSAPEAPVLVAVVNNPADLERARTEGWYRIPLSRAPARIGADFLAFYQTGAFPEEERWAVRWLAAIRGYHLATRRELLPDEPNHPRADDRYYRVELEDLAPLPHPIPSLRLRRIAFIRTTLGRLLEAREINDLWVRTPGQERLWRALQQAGLEDQVEHEYPLMDDLPYTASFAVFPDGSSPTTGRVAVIVVDRDQELGDCIRDRADLDYPLARGGWRAVFVDPADSASIARCLADIARIRSESSART
jgi:hypothetical protein